MPACAGCGEPNTKGATFCRRCGRALSSTHQIPVAGRKVVTVLFADVSGFTALGEGLDPESLQQLMGRWFREAYRVIGRHGGSVEKFMGDAVMAVFGVPVVHEDDALRAARAALEMGEALVELNEELARRWGVRLEVRTGLNTGEVVIGNAPGGELSTVGDAVNVAQRLEASAKPGQVLIGPQTARLLDGAAQLEAVDPLTLKGKASPVSAWQLVSVSSEAAGPPARATMPFVGREDELGLLHEAMARVIETKAPRLVTVLGPAGIGKSRLVESLLSSMPEDATAVIGRCLPYGEGITYWPVAEIVRQLSGGTDEAAVASLVSTVSGEEASSIATRVAQAAGFVGGNVAVEEAQWAVRKLLEGVARRGPLVVVFEDIHWAEPVLLDLLEHLITLAAEVPLLLICLARRELLDERPSWTTLGGNCGTTIPLAPLSSVEADDLLHQLASGLALTAEARGRLLDTAEGNPFFLQQMVAMRAETPGEETAVPPTIHAVITARIDHLPRPERAVLERASIEGRTFHHGALAELLPEPERSELDTHLAALVRRGLIRPGRPEFANEQAHAFEHILIRDATYSLISKHLRAELHERHARWLERRRDQELGKHEELAGYHLEQAFRCRLELEPAARESYRPLAVSGGLHLGTAGRAALARDDMPAAINFLQRATALLPDDEPTLRALTPELGIALTEAGRLSEAGHVLESAATMSASRGDPVAEAHARVAGLFARIQVDTEAAAQEVRERFDSLLATFERGGDELGVGRLWRLRGLVHWLEARSTDADSAWQQAVEHARRADDERGWSDALRWLASSAYIGPTKAEEGIARCENIREALRGHPRSQALVRQPLAGLRAMRGEFDAALRLLGESNAILAELGVTMHTAVSHHEAAVRLASGDAAGAEAVLRTGYELLAEMGEKALLATTAAMLGQVLYERGRHEDAWAFTQTAENTAAHDDLTTQIIWRAVRARVLAGRGEIAEAKRLSSDAVKLAARTDWLADHADALLSRAEVLGVAREGAGATEALHEAIALYERKGNTIGARRARSMLADQVPA